MVARKVSPPNRKITPAAQVAAAPFRPYLLISLLQFTPAGSRRQSFRGRRNIAKKIQHLFPREILLVEQSHSRAASSPVRIATRASTHSPSTLPRMSHGAIFTRGLLRMRFTFPETPIVYTYSFASLESRLADGSAAKPYRRLHTLAAFLECFEFKYLCPANAANPIASLLPLRCALLYMCHKHKRQAICQPAFWSAALFRSITRRNFSAPENATPPLTSPGRTSHLP